MRPKDVLAEAALVMNRRGYCAGSYYRGDPRTGPVCAVGAINVATYGWPSLGAMRLKSPTHDELLLALEAETRLVVSLGIDARDLTDWSDWHDKDYVVTALKKAAERETP